MTHKRDLIERKEERKKTGRRECQNGIKSLGLVLQARTKIDTNIDIKAYIRIGMTVIKTADMKQEMAAGMKVDLVVVKIIIGRSQMLLYFRLYKIEGK